MTALIIGLGLIGGSVARSLKRILIGACLDMIKTYRSYMRLNTPVHWTVCGTRGQSLTQI